MICGCSLLCSSSDISGSWPDVCWSEIAEELWSMRATFFSKSGWGVMDILRASNLVIANRIMIMLNLAEGPDLTIEALLVDLLFDHDQPAHWYGLQLQPTASIDAAAKLLRDTIPGYDYGTNDHGENGCFAEVWKSGYRDDTFIISEAPTVPLALCKSIVKTYIKLTQEG